MLPTGSKIPICLPKGVPRGSILSTLGAQSGPNSTSWAPKATQRAPFCGPWCPKVCSRGHLDAPGMYFGGSWASKVPAGALFGVCVFFCVFLAVFFKARAEHGRSHCTYPARPLARCRSLAAARPLALFRSLATVACYCFLMSAAARFF